MSSPGKPGSMSSRQAAAKGPKPSAAGNAAEDSAQPHVYVSIQKLIESVVCSIQISCHEMCQCGGPNIPATLRSGHAQGVEEYEPQVVDMIVDFIYSYTTDVLRDAQAFGDAAGQTHGKVNLADVELAIHSRADMSFAQAPNLEVQHPLSLHTEHYLPIAVQTRFRQLCCRHFLQIQTESTLKPFLPSSVPLVCLFHQLTHCLQPMSSIAGMEMTLRQLPGIQSVLNPLSQCQQVCPCRAVHLRYAVRNLQCQPWTVL